MKGGEMKGSKDKVVSMEEKPKRRGGRTGSSIKRKISQLWNGGALAIGGMDNNCHGYCDQHTNQ
jgi:hypothetical protein